MLIGDNIRAALDHRAILHGVDFEARAGEVTAIVGPNGSGKTTLLRALTGEVAAEGAIVLNGRSVARMKPWEAASLRAVLPQATRLAFPFRVAEVVRMGLRAGPFAGRPHIVGEALAAVGLTHHAGRLFQELSGGEQQRAQLARVLCQVWEPTGADGPRWLFLDEPVASLDIAHQLQVMDLARSFADRGGGVVAVMHDLNLTAAFADRVLVLRAGTTAAFGLVQDALGADILSQVYGVPISVGSPPTSQLHWIFPKMAERRDRRSG